MRGSALGLVAVSLTGLAGCVPASGWALDLPSDRPRDSTCDPELLAGLKALVTAEARFRVIAEDAQHPFRDDAVRRLHAEFVS